MVFGPAGFDAYARLRMLPDPARFDQSESDVEVEDWRQGQLPRLFEVLATHTTTPQLTSDRQLDVIRADPTKDQPSYH